MSAEGCLKPPRYEKGVLRLPEPLQHREGEEILVRVERAEERRRIVEEFLWETGLGAQEVA